MISDSWKAIFKKEKSIFNQMVFFQKQNHSQFKEESLELFFSPFYSALSKCVPEPSSLEVAIDSFEILLTFIQKGFLKDRQGGKEVAFLNLISKLKKCFDENLKLTISYIVNSVSKVKSSQEEVLLQKLALLGEQINNLGDLKNTLVVLCWLCGQAQYRLTALKVFNELPKSIQNHLQDEFHLDSVDFVSTYSINPFGTTKVNDSNKIRYKIISGYPLLGGDFFTLPLLKKGSDCLSVFANQRHFQLYFDQFGDHISPSEELVYEPLKKSISPFWKVVITKVFPENNITSFFDTEFYSVVTTNLSYSVFVFYRVPL